MTSIFNSPYWFQLGNHQSGVNIPLTSPKSPGEIHTPMGTSLSTKEMSEGQSLFTPGASLESSMEKVISSIFWAVGSTLGIRYST